MKRRKLHITIITAAAILFLGVQCAIASFSGFIDDKKDDKFSLKNLNKLSKNYSLPSLRLTNVSIFKGLQQEASSLTSASNSNYFMRFEQGNTNYVFPYKYKIKSPKFKTPSPSSLR